MKLDLTTIFNAYGEAPGCWAKDHDHGNWAESLNMIYEGISYVTGKIYEKHPDVLLDLTFELWGQKHIIDAGLLAAGDLDWMSNVDDGETRFGRTLAGPPVALPARRLDARREHADRQYARRAAHDSGELCHRHRFGASAARRSAQAERRRPSAGTTKKSRWFKKLRRSTKISESFFPLGSWLQTSPAAWDGFARLEHSGNGVIALFRNKSRDEQALVRLPLLPAGKFKLHSVISGKEIGVFTSSDWIRGVALKFPGEEPVEVLEVTAIRA